MYLSELRSYGTSFITCLYLLKLCKYRFYSFAKGEYIPSIVYPLCLYQYYLFKDLRLQELDGPAYFTGLLVLVARRQMLALH